MAGTGLDRLSVLPSGLAHQRHNMHRISIAMSGGPNPAEILDLVGIVKLLGMRVSSGNRRYSLGVITTAPPFRRLALSPNWLRVSDTAERSPVDQRLGHHLPAIVPLLDAFTAEQQPLARVLPRTGAFDPHPSRMDDGVAQPLAATLG